ncbi:hypothetical protein GF407_00765 [candidate division KSB1 bacterium]|nr:hypothetical protein [candidate division KSB1 bacterium]
MTIRRLEIFYMAFICLMFCRAPLFFAASDSGFTIVQQNHNSMLVEWTAPELSWQMIQADADVYALPVLPGLGCLQNAGQPQLPFAVFLPDLPPGMTASVTVVDSLVQVLPCQRIAPAPELDVDGEADLVYKEGESYSQSGFYPRKRIFYESAGGQKHVHHRIALNPLRYNPVQGKINFLRYIRFKVQFLPSLQKAALAKPSARDFTTVKQVSSSLPPYPAVKILITDSRVYSLSGADLAGLGVDIGAIDPQTLQLFRKGDEQPLYTSAKESFLQGSDEIRFYAERRRGDSTFYHALSDTNVYWLTWAKETGSRYMPIDIAPDSSAPENRIFVKEHFEEDNHYYEGDSDQDIQNSDPVAGEGWVWFFINRGGSFRYSFSLPHLHPQTDSARLFIKLRGTTLSPITPDHHVTILLNGELIRDFTFEDREEQLADIRVEGLLRAGENSLEIRSLSDIEGARSQFYLDWIEIVYPQTTTADQGLLAFADTVSSWFVDGFAHPDIVFWDLSNGLSQTLVGEKHRLRRIEVNSGGYSDGNHAIFTLENEKLYHGSRGHNLVLLDPGSGAVLRTRTFDTWKSAENADSLASFLNAIEPGIIVLGAIRDEGSKNLNEAVYLAYESIGSRYIRRIKDRESWSIIGIKGAQPGSVVETLRAQFQGPAISQQLWRFESADQGFAALFKPKQPGRFVIFDRTAMKKPPRMVLEQGSDLRTNLQHCDYILLTHPLFRPAAENLALYRSRHDGLDVRVVLIDDVYDEFNFGLADETAIRHFLQFACSNWQSPAPRYLSILGDASWDPKNLSGPNSRTNYIPSYGNPVSDVWFALLDGEEDLLPDLAVGRIPAQTPAQAEAYIEKLQEYEQSPSSSWKKHFTFITGGFNRIEQTAFMQQAEQLTSKYIDTSPVNGTVTFINKQSQGYIEGEHRQDILNAVNNGTVWLNFTGHAGSRTWDLMFHEPDVYELGNAPRYPFITSMTCHTGRFAEPLQESFAEIFIHSPQKGAIAFMGTSGWGYSSEDHLFMEELYPLVLQDSLRVLGEAITRAKAELWKQFGSTRHIRNSILQYALIGDPATRLELATRPDPALRPGALVLSPQVPSEADSFLTVKLIFDNFGLRTVDSLHINLKIEHEKSGYENTIHLISPPLATRDSLEVNIPLRDRAGLLKISARLDPQDFIDEAEEDNNFLSRQLYVLSSRLRILSPFRDNLLPAEAAQLRILNPQRADTGSHFYEFQIDTSHFFSSPLLKSSGPVPAGRLYTQWTPPALLSDQLYFWRVRDSAHPNAVSWARSVFYTESRTVFGWRQHHYSQFSNNTLFQLQKAGKSVSLQQARVEMYVESAGFTDGNYARLFVGEQSLMEASRGHNVAVIDPGNGMVLSTRTFDTYQDSLNANEMAAMIEALPDSFIVLLAIRDDGSRMMTERAYRALETLGSIHCRQVGMRDSWALIGRKNVPSGSAAELWRQSGSGTAVVRDTLCHFYPTGLMRTGKIGPTRQWKKLSWHVDTPPSCAVTLTVLGHHRQKGTVDTLLVNNVASSELDLSGLSAGLYPSLSLEMNMSTIDGRFTPVLKWWQMEFEPVPDLALAADGLRVKPDSAMSGEEVFIEVEVFNIGQADCDSVTVSLSAETPENGVQHIATKLFSGIKRDQSVSVQQKWQTPPVPGQYQLVARADTGRSVAEMYDDNNIALTMVRVLPDTIKPAIRFAFDGREIPEGDWVSTRPHIQIKIFDNHNTTYSDTSNIHVFLDQHRINFSDSERLFLSPPSSASMNALVEYYPQLTAGNHSLGVLVQDGGKNQADAVAYFKVTDELKFLNLMNYPNPVFEETDFTFELTRPAQVSIKIYTVAGKLLSILQPQYCPVGFNHFHWDAKDQEGDELANGVYLYKAIARGENDNAEEIGRLLIMR